MITILTHKKNSNLKFLAKFLIKFFIIFFTQKLFLDIKRLKEIIIYSGHIDVTKSIIKGLRENEVKYNINPKNNKDYFQNVLVLSGIKELKIAIKLKENNYINKILAGPNISILPRDINYLFDNKNIDRIITPSKWVSDSYRNEVINNNRIIEWAAGVNLEFWKPEKKIKKKYILVYIKKKISKNKISFYLNYLKKNNIKYKIINYGFYNPKKYLKLLRNSYLLVFFSQSESQGLSLLESWSVNVPTLVFSNNKFYYKNIKIKSDTAPYLTAHTGSKFKNINEFKKEFNYMMVNLKLYNTRKWVMNNMSDKICAKNLINKINEI